MHVKSQTFLILGVSKSGYAVAEHLLTNGAKCFLFEEKRSAKIDLAIKELVEKGATVVKLSEVEDVLKMTDVVV